MLRLIAITLLASCLLGGGALFAQATVGAGATKAVKAKESEGRIYGALVLAKPDASVASAKADSADAAAESDFAKLTPRLGKAFPDYKGFELLGEHRQALFKQYETWVVPSRDLFLKIDSKGPAEGGGMKLHLQVWQDEQVILKTDPVLKPGQPLFIGGPKWRGGKLLIVVGLEE